MAWQGMVSQAHSMSEYLGEELQGPLSVPVEGAGEGSCDGSTRMAITSQMEGLKLKVMDEYLGRKGRNKERARPVWSWPNRDKISTAWLLSLPTCAGSSLTTPIFREGLAMVLCLPCLPGGGWTTRHDRLKMELMAMFGWSDVVATCEVWGLFQHLVPQAALARHEVRD